MRVLGIETSCDDTAVAVMDAGRVLAERAVTQEAHRRYLGVVPELASREHLELLFPMITSVVDEAGLSLEDIEGIAVTCGPGLVGCLLVGVSTAKSLAYSLGIPLIGINHIHAHLTSAAIEHDDVTGPFLGLVVSGGHTEFFQVEDEHRVIPLGSTLDDAAGEAFDKVAKLLGLGYPGGAVIDSLAGEGDPGFTRFPRPLLGPGSLDVSFSGLKTAVRNFVRQRSGPLTREFQANVAAAFQAAVVDVLVTKLDAALTSHPSDTVVVAGGVACNSELRRRAAGVVAEHGARLRIPSPRYCGDNAVMVARLGESLLSQGFASDLSLGAYPSLEVIASRGPIFRRR